MIARGRQQLVLAIYFQSSGFAFTLLDRELNPIDWGAREVGGPDRAARTLKHIDSLLSLHAPDVLVLQDMTRGGTRRAPRIQNLNRQTLQLAKRHHILVQVYSRAQVVNFFEKLGATTKQSIAARIAREISAVPPRRKPWKSEDPRMGIFDAAALAWLFIDSGAEP